MHKKIRKTLLGFWLLCLAIPAQAQQPNKEWRDPLTVNEHRARRGLTEMDNVFVPKGQWILEANASYSTHDNNSYNFLIIEGIESDGYTFKVSPLLAYAVRDNMSIGLRAVYSRTNLMIDRADVVIGDDATGTQINVSDYRSIKHSYSVALSWRQYIPLGRSKRFAFFNEMQLGAGGIQSKFAAGQPVKGTYESGYTLSLGVSPGLVAFATNNVAIEVNVGVMGISYTDVEQVHNQVTVGHRRSSNMNFKVNIFSIGVGLACYL